MSIIESALAVKGSEMNLINEKKAAESSGGDFQGLLKNLVTEVDSLQKDANASIQDLVSGEGSTSIHDVTLKMNEAGVAFDLMMQVRNKLLEAYQQVLRMQV